jgi:TetR/AcrR family transcriptional regulator, fatty acid biosynthesis regulator
MDNINRKLRTRKALMNSALELVGEGQHFSSLSLREVAKRAGVVPNAFYRHFKNLDELGLALADEVGLLLRQLMRQARLQGLAADRMISDSVDFFISNVLNNPTLFRFMSQSRTGGSESLREAIRNELSFFATEMVMDLNRLRILSHVESIDLDMIGHLVVQTVSGIASELLDLPPDSENLVNAIRQRTIKQVRLIFLGASQWHSVDDKEKKRKSKAKFESELPRDLIIDSEPENLAVGELAKPSEAPKRTEQAATVSKAKSKARADKAAAVAKAKSKARADKAAAVAKAKEKAKIEKAAAAKAKAQARADKAAATAKAKEKAKAKKASAHQESLRKKAEKAQSLKKTK